MKLPNTKFEKCAAEDRNEPRKYLTQPWLDADKARLVATNGHVIAVIPVEVDDDDTTGHVPMEAVKAARKVYRKDGHVLLEAADANVYGTRFPRGDLGKYPDVDRVLDLGPTGNDAPDMVLDARLLYNLAQALIACKSTEQARVKLYFKRDEKGEVDKTSAIRVEGVGPDALADAFGLIMPCRDDD